MSRSSIRRLVIVSSQAFSLANFRGPLIRALVEAGVEVHALAPDFDRNTREAVRTWGALPTDCSLSRTGMNPFRDLWSIATLARAFRRIRPDAVLGYFIKPVIYGSFAAKLAGVPQRFSLIEGLGYVFTPSEALESLSRRILRLAVVRLYGLALRLNKKVFFLNKDDIEDFTKRELVRTGQAVRLDGIGLDLAHFAQARGVTTPISFLLIARPLKEKGVYDFVEAARLLRRSHPDTKFVLLGGLDENPGSIKKSELAAWVAEGLIEWSGQVADVRPWLERTSVFVLPSYREGLPRSTQEAMAMGRPIITSDVPGCRETIEANRNGFLVPVRDPQALALAMERFVENPGLIETMGAESRRIAEARFDIHAINRQILSAMGIEVKDYVSDAEKRPITT